MRVHNNWFLNLLPLLRLSRILAAVPTVLIICGRNIMVRVRGMLGFHQQRTIFEKKEWRMTRAEDGKHYASPNRRIEGIIINRWASMRMILDTMMILPTSRRSDVIVNHLSLSERPGDCLISFNNGYFVVSFSLLCSIFDFTLASIFLGLGDSGGVLSLIVLFLFYFRVSFEGPLL